jgi:hypothetical protein
VRTLLENLRNEIRLCYERAAEAKQRADRVLDPEAKADFLNMERRWLLLARSNESETLDDFTQESARQAKQARAITSMSHRQASVNILIVDDEPRNLTVLIPYPTPLRDSTGKIVGAINIVLDISERKQAESQQRILLNELNHRAKNNMQMLQILLEAGTRRAKSSEAREVLEEASGRIIAMAAAQRVLYTTHDATRFNARDFLNTVCETARQSSLRN